VPGLPLHTEGFVLHKQPPADRFQQFTVLSADHGLLRCLRRLAARSAAAALDLFDEVDLWLASSNQGRTWFVQEARVAVRHAAIGRSYDTLALASRFASILARNPVPEEGRSRVCDLLRQTLQAFDASARPDVVYLKALYCFARDEGYPVKQEWWRDLPAAERDAAAGLLNRPVSAQTAAPPEVTLLTRRLEDYLRGQTDILLE
jgi:recombinational DNA repair protein (RecF pathway)